MSEAEFINYLANIENKELILRKKNFILKVYFLED